MKSAPSCCISLHEPDCEWELRPAAAQRGGVSGAAGEGADGVENLADLEVTEAEDGEWMTRSATRSSRIMVNARMRHRSGAVTLIGAVLAQAGTRPNVELVGCVILRRRRCQRFRQLLSGFIHVAEGLLGLMKNEAEARRGSGAREWSRRTAEQPTIDAVQKNDMVSLASDEVGARAARWPSR